MEKLIKLINKFEPCCEQEEKDKEMFLKYIGTFMDVLTRDNDMCHFTSSAWVVNKDRTKVLMIHHNIYNSWAWIGGHADGEEDLLKVAIREVKEETGLSNIKVIDELPFSIQLLPVKSHIKRGKFVASHLHMDCCFLFEADDNSDIRIKEDENSGVKWIDIDKVVDMSNEEHMKPIYSKIIDKLNNN